MPFLPQVCFIWSFWGHFVHFNAIFATSLFYLIILETFLFILMPFSPQVYILFDNLETFLLILMPFLPQVCFIWLFWRNFCSF